MGHAKPFGDTGLHLFIFWFGYAWIGLCLFLFECSKAMAPFEASWSCEELAKHLCDLLATWIQKAASICILNKPAKYCKMIRGFCAAQ